MMDPWIQLAELIDAGKSILDQAQGAGRMGATNGDNNENAMCIYLLISWVLNRNIWESIVVIGISLDELK